MSVSFTVFGPPQDEFGNVIPDTPVSDTSAKDTSATDTPLIEGLLGHGYTVLASQRPAHRYHFSIQAAHAIANGEDFLGYKTRQCPVVYVARGKADYEYVRDHYRHPWLFIEPEWPRLGTYKFESKLGEYLNRNRRPEALFLGDYINLKWDIRESSPPFLQELKKYREDSGKYDSIILENLVKESEENNGIDLWEISDKYGIAVMVGVSLNTHNMIPSWRSLRQCDDELYILPVRRKRNQGNAARFILQVENCETLTTMSTEELIYRDKRFYREPEKEAQISWKRQLAYDVVVKYGSATPWRVTNEALKLFKAGKIPYENPA